MEEKSLEIVRLQRLCAFGDAMTTPTTDVINTRSLYWKYITKPSIVPTNLQYNIKSHKKPCSICRYIINGTHLVSCGQDGIVQFHNADNGKQGQSIVASTKPLRTLDISPNSQSIAFGGDDTTLYIWDIFTKHIKKPQEFYHTHNIVSCSYIQPNILMTCTTNPINPITIFNIDTPHIFSKYNLEYKTNIIPTSITSTSDNKCIISQNIDISILQITESGKIQLLQKNEQCHTESITSLEPSNTNSNIFLSTSRDSTLKLWDIRMNTQTCVSSFSHYSYRCAPFHGARACLSPDDLYIAAGDMSGSITFWDTRSSNEALHSTLQHDSMDHTTSLNAIHSVQWNPLGRQLAAVSHSGSVLFFS